MEINKEDIHLNYECDVVEDFKPIDYQMWAINFFNDNDWEAFRILGFGKVISNPNTFFNSIEYTYTLEKIKERTIEWKPVYLELNCLTPIKDGWIIIYGSFDYSDINEIAKDIKNVENKDFYLTSGFNLHKYMGGKKRWEK